MKPKVSGKEAEKRKRESCAFDSNLRKMRRPSQTLNLVGAGGDSGGGCDQECWEEKYSILLS